jgi:hypothetical protein
VSYGGVGSGKDTAKYNVIIGAGAMYQSKGSLFNTIIGSSINGLGTPTVNTFGNTMLGAAILSTSSAQLNTLIGYKTKSSGDAFVANATALGALAQVDTSDALVLGCVDGVNTASSNTNVAIGTTKPKAALHVSRGDVGNTATMPSNRNLLIEDNATNYIQLLSPNNSETGIFAGNAQTLVKGGIIFRADSSIQIKAGGNANRITVDNEGHVGIGLVLPSSSLHVAGSFATSFINTAVSITLNEKHRTLVINAAATITVTLPVANDCPGREYIIVNQDAFVHTITGYRDFTNAYVTSIPAFSSITLQSDGVINWYRIR